MNVVGDGHGPCCEISAGIRKLKSFGEAVQQFQIAHCAKWIEKNHESSAMFFFQFLVHRAAKRRIGQRGIKIPRRRKPGPRKAWNGRIRPELTGTLLKLGM